MWPLLSEGEEEGGSACRFLGKAILPLIKYYIKHEKYTKSNHAYIFDF